MRCPVCSMQAPSGVCVRPHDAVALAAFLGSRPVVRDYGQPYSRAGSSNVERVDGEDGVTLVITGVGTHVVRGDFAALQRRVREECKAVPREVLRTEKRHLARGLERIERLAELYGLEVEIRAPEGVR